MKTIIFKGNAALLSYFRFLLKGTHEYAKDSRMRVERATEGLVDFVCTDWHRLYRLSVFESRGIEYFEDGEYTFKVCAYEKETLVIFEKSDQITPFPDWRKVFPSKEDMTLIFEDRKADKIDLSHNFLFPLYYAGIRLNGNYVEDLCGFIWRCFIIGKDKPVVFECDGIGAKLYALIMPMKLTDDADKIREIYETVCDTVNQL